MGDRKILDQRIEAYAAAVRNRDAEAVAALFAESFDHVVHGMKFDADTPWTTKRETNREGIRKIYMQFFDTVKEFTVEYTDRVIDVENNSAALIVRVLVGETKMENSLLLNWDEDGKIIFFYNWYGHPLENS